MRIEHTDMQEKTEISKILQTAKKLWSKRDDLPDFLDLRKSFDRRQLDDKNIHLPCSNL